MRNFRAIAWTAVVLGGTVSVATIALHRGESLGSVWFIAAAACVYALAYRFYSAFLAARVLSLDGTRATPAERLEDGRDHVPTHRWVVFGHHFAAIAGPGPLIGPTLAAQFGYLPGTLWILFGSVLGGCVQDMTALFFSTRRDGRSLGRMARDELGPFGGAVAQVSVMAIMVILIAVLGLVVVNAMKHSPWATSTVGLTIPIALLVGTYMRLLRPGKVLEASAIGVALLLLSVVAGGWIGHSAVLGPLFDRPAPELAIWVIGYGFLAALLPVWLLLAPRDYLSTFMKLGTIALLAVAICLLRPEVHMPALTRFTDGTGPVFGGKLFPFAFITIACGAVSGFHSLIASGTTPKLLVDERDVRLVGYGAMILESAVAMMAMVAACVLEPGVYFAINSPGSVVGAIPADAVRTISSWGFHVDAGTMENFAREMGEKTLFSRTGGAPSLAVGMASLLSRVFGGGIQAIWYHFAIMFEALFILTTLDAGTRVGRFMLQDLLGHVWKPLGRTSWLPSAALSSVIVVAAWGWFLYTGTLDPFGGINSLWPLFGISNQMLATIALGLATTLLVKTGRSRYAWTTAAPMVWLATVTTWASVEKLWSSDPRVGFLAHARTLAEKAAAGKLPKDQMDHLPQLLFNDRLDAVLTALFGIAVWILLLDVARVCWRSATGRSVPPSTETPHVPTRFRDAAGAPILHI
jgi:carbon starvation protein